MDLKDILVCVDATEAGEGRLRLAGAIAREHGAHLSAAYLLPAANGDRGAEIADKVEQRFRDAVHPHTIAGDWHLFAAGEGEHLIALMKTVDLAVFGQASPDHRPPSGFRPDDLVMAGGRPVLVVPYAGGFGAVGRRVLVAWDGTREASRALHDALPVIAEAKTVIVMTVRADEASAERIRRSLDQVVRHLARHGIPAHPEDALRGDIPVSDLLLSRAADFDADLIVAGAYHHSPLREALLGGVSRELLQHMTVPVLMSH
jgi:nucleotide-binding universal stress UspA family protein